MNETTNDSVQHDCSSDNCQCDECLRYAADPEGADEHDYPDND